jgi:hypothetical protein
MTQTQTPVQLKYIKSILESQGNITCTNIDENVSHDQLTRMLHQEQDWQTLLFLFLMLFNLSKNGKLIIDDTIIEKPFMAVDLEKYPHIRYHYSNKTNSTVVGIQVVTLVYVINNTRLILGYRIYDGSKTKIELALELLSLARNHYKLRPKMVLFDIWYGASTILKRIRNYGWVFVTRIKKNRKIDDPSRSDVKYTPRCSFYGKIAGIKVKIVKNGKYILITNRTSMSNSEMKQSYGGRGTIEETYKLKKKVFHLKDCQGKVRNVWENHIFFSILGYHFVEFKRQENKLTSYKAHAKFIFQDYSKYIALWKRISGDT